MAEKNQQTSEDSAFQQRFPLENYTKTFPRKTYEFPYIGLKDDCPSLETTWARNTAK